MEQLDILVIAGICAWITRFLRKSAWFPMVNEKTHYYVAAIVAATAAIGIHFTFDAAAGTLLISGLQMNALPHMAVEFIRTFALQQGADRVLHGPGQLQAGNIST